MSINVKNIDKEELLLTLYNHAKPLGMGFLAYDNKPMNRDEAQKIIAKQCTPNSCYFDYLKGRPLKTEISKDEIDLGSYKIDQSHVDIESIINDLRESKTALTENGNLEIINDPKTSLISYTIRPSRADEYLTYFAKKLIDLGSVINPNTGRQSLNSYFAKIDLAGKCEDIKYKDSYSKDILIKFDLYPWEWSDNSKQAVEALCSLVGDLGELKKEATLEIDNIFHDMGH